MSTFGDFTVTRASSKRVLGSAGTLVTYANNEPAFEFNANGTYRGLSVEPGATNLFRDSDPASDPGQGTRTDITFATNNWGLGFSGKIIYGDNSTVRVYYNTGNLSASTLYSFSFYIKPNNGIQPTFGNAGSNIGRFVLSSVSVTTGYTITPTSIPGVFYVTGSGTTGVSNLANNGFIKQTGNNAVGFEITGFQIELGPVATSYIPTVASTANRSADAVTLTGASSLIGQTEGSVFAEIEWRNTGGATRIWTIDDTGTQNLRLSKLSGQTLLFASTVTVGDNGSITSAGSYSGIVKTAMGYATNDMIGYVNGASVGTDTTVTIPPTSRIYLGSVGAADQLNGWIRSVALYKTRLSNAQLQALTTL